MRAIENGDRVAYSVRFLRSIREGRGKLAAGRGNVTAIKEYGGGLVLADVEWDQLDLPGRVNIENLARVGSNREFCNVD